MEELERVEQVRVHVFSVCLSVCTCACVFMYVWLRLSITFQMGQDLGRAQMGRGLASNNGSENGVPHSSPPPPCPSSSCFSGLTLRDVSQAFLVAGRAPALMTLAGVLLASTAA